MRIAICDDETRDRDNIKRAVQTHNLSHEIIEFNSAVPLMESISGGHSFDVLFLDIEMPDSNGWIVAEQIKELNINIYIAMVTVRAEYIYDCFDRVNWFIAKPAPEEKIHKILNNAHDRLFPAVIEFEYDNVPVILTAPEIMYVEVRKNDVYIFAVGKEYKIRETMTVIKHKFNLPCFVSTHQSYIVNLDHYDTIEENDIVLKNKDKIPLSRNKRKDFYNALREYIKRKKTNVL